MLSLGDDLSWGPIGPGNVAERVAFFEEECPIPGGWSWLAKAHDDFWQAVAEWQGERLIWLGSNSGCELAGYLAYLDRFHAFPAHVLRIDDYLAPHPVHGPAGSVGVLDIEDVADLLDNAPTSDIARDEGLFGRWVGLVSDGALLRVVEDGRLKSASLDHFDHFILDVATTEWKPGVRVVADALAAAFDARIWVNSDFLFSRLSRLAKSGELEADGDVLGWTKTMRRSPTHVRKRAPVS